MGTSIEFKIGGRTVSSREWTQNIRDELLKEARSKILDAIRKVRCPVHGERPTNIRASGPTGDMQFQFNACCERLREEVKKAFR
jgi:hypothetical protein